MWRCITELDRDEWAELGLHVIFVLAVNQACLMANDQQVVLRTRISEAILHKLPFTMLTASGFYGIEVADEG